MRTDNIKRDGIDEEKVGAVRRTVVDAGKFDKRIGKDEGIISLGSCFSSEIGEKLRKSGYRICNNPFGVLYNPASIANSIRLLESGKSFDVEDVILRDTNPVRPEKRKKRDGTIAAANAKRLSVHRPIASCPAGYTTFYHHGSFTKETPEAFLENANSALAEARNAYKEARWVIVTFGTAWVYRHIERDIIVSNCHKHPAQEFAREFLSEEETVNLFSDILKASDKNWIFTVSPIRHRKDGLHANQISKATLLLATERLCKISPRINYFPSYEIVLDELRDYSFFKEDLVNPAAAAIDIVFSRFASALL